MKRQNYSSKVNLNVGGKDDKMNKKRLVSGRFGCVPKVSEYTKTSTLLCSRDQQVYSPKLHRVNLLTKIEEIEEKDEELFASARP